MSRRTDRPDRGAVRHPVELIRQPVETGIDLAEFFAGEHRFALDGSFLLVLAFAAAAATTALGGALVAVIAPAAGIVSLEGGSTFKLALAPAAAAFAPRFAIFGTRPVAIVVAMIMTVFVVAVVAPAVIVLAVIFSKPHRLDVIVVALLDDVVEPFADRYAGPACRVAGGIARVWSEASEIPRTARFHCALKPHRRNENRPVLGGCPLTDEAAGVVLCPRCRLFRIRVNKSLKRA